MNSSDLATLAVFVGTHMMLDLRIGNGAHWV